MQLRPPPTSAATAALAAPPGAYALQDLQGVWPAGARPPALPRARDRRARPEDHLGRRAAAGHAAGAGRGAGAEGAGPGRWGAAQGAAVPVSPGPCTPSSPGPCTPGPIPLPAPAALLDCLRTCIWRLPRTERPHAALPCGQPPEGTRTCCARRRGERSPPPPHPIHPPPPTTPTTHTHTHTHPSTHPPTPPTRRSCACRWSTPARRRRPPAPAAAARWAAWSWWSCLGGTCWSRSPPARCSYWTSPQMQPGGGATPGMPCPAARWRGLQAGTAFACLRGATPTYPPESPAPGGRLPRRRVPHADFSSPAAFIHLPFNHSFLAFFETGPAQASASGVEGNTKGAGWLPSALACTSVPDAACRRRQPAQSHTPAPSQLPRAAALEL